MSTVKDKIFYAGDQLKAEIDVFITRERDAPSIKKCRYAALPLDTKRYVVYDRLLSRIVNGVFFGDLECVLEVARLYNQGEGREDMSPNGLALGLIYPETE